jgi:hypothetical protein
MLILTGNKIVKGRRIGGGILIMFLQCVQRCVGASLCFDYC